MKLILFDIDGTILWTDGAGRRAMEGALLHVFGTSGDPNYRYDGKTDRQIAREQMRNAGFSEVEIDKKIEDLVESYLENLSANLRKDPSAAVLCEGVNEVLDAVEAEPNLVMGLLTGNVHDGARHKLSAVGIDINRFRVNAFGSDHEHRPELPLIAQKRAYETLGRDLPGTQMVIIGDTPADIECGRPIGAKSVAVATGRYGVEDLAAYSPDSLFANMADLDSVMQALLA